MLKFTQIASNGVGIVPVLHPLVQVGNAVSVFNAIGIGLCLKQTLPETIAIDGYVQHDADLSVRIFRRQASAAIVKSMLQPFGVSMSSICFQIGITV